jgi:MOSC domain-containing protein YiiM
VANRDTAHGESTGRAKRRGRFRVLSINVSSKTGVRKHPVGRAVMRTEHGVEGDAHAGEWHRQVSLLANEKIETMRGRGIEIGYGDFAENLTTEGVYLISFPVETRITIGDSVLEVTQIGKQCHHGCAIYRAVGDCVMPREGIFARVVRGGEINCESVCHYDL